MYCHMKATALNFQFQFIFQPFHLCVVDSTDRSFISACACLGLRGGFAG